jgi:uncharacterized protein YegL
MQADGKIQSLNNAIREAIPHMQQAAAENPNAHVLVRALRFSDGAQWHLAVPTPVANFKWSDLSAEGVTDMGRAMQMLAEQLKIPPMTDRALPPVAVLISDGQPTDDFGQALKALMDVPWARRAVRIAIAIGDDADQGPLRAFIGHPEIPVLQANSAEALVSYIRWASTAVLRAASAPASPGQDAGSVSGLAIPAPAAPSSLHDEVW